MSKGRIFVEIEQECVLPKFELKFNFLERLKNYLPLPVRENGNKGDETETFKNDIEAKSTKKSAVTAVRRFCCWYEGKRHKELELNKMTKQEAPPNVKALQFRNSTDK